MALLNLTYVSIAFWLKGSKTKQQMNISFNREAKGGSHSSEGMGGQVVFVAAAEWRLFLSLRLSNPGDAYLIISVR